jgi:hypothetical protein
LSLPDNNSDKDYSTNDSACSPSTGDDVENFLTDADLTSDPALEDEMVLKSLDKLDASQNKKTRQE